MRRDRDGGGLMNAVYVARVDFFDLKDEAHLYRAGEPYPRPGLKPTKKRLAELSTSANKMGYPLIERAEARKEAGSDD